MSRRASYKWNGFPRTPTVSDAPKGNCKLLHKPVPATNPSVTLRFPTFSFFAFMDSPLAVVYYVIIYGPKPFHVLKSRLTLITLYCNVYQTDIEF